MDNVIEVADVRKSFKAYRSLQGKKVFLASLRREYYTKKALQGVSFTVRKGETVALLGENGSGKSTIMKLLTGILYPDSGSVKVLGMVPWEKRKELSMDMGVVFGKQDSLYWNLPAVDTFDFLRRLYEIPEATYRKRLSMLVKVLNLEDVYKGQVRTMSLGERMKCNFVAAVLHNPKVVFLDEPTIGVDLSSGIALRKALLEMRERYGTTFILATHIVEDVDAMAQRVIIMDKGRKVFDGTKEELKRVFGSKKELEVYFSERPRVNPSRYGRVLSSKENYMKLEIDSRRLRSREVTGLLTGSGILDYNVSEPSLSTILGKLYARQGRARGRGGME